jgi:hypothetical protein
MIANIAIHGRAQAVIARFNFHTITKIIRRRKEQALDFFKSRLLH